MSGLETGPRDLSAPSDEVVTRHTPAQMTRPVSTWGVDVALGSNADGVVHKFGYAVCSTTRTDISYGVPSVPWLTTAETLRVASGGNANDDIAGTGARTLTIEGLDENGAAISETIDLAGAAQSLPTAATFLREFRAYVATVGAYDGVNAGDITIETSTGTTVMVVPAGLSQTFVATYSVPAGCKALLMGVYARVEGNKSADVTLWRRNRYDVTAPGSTQPWRTFDRAVAVLGTLQAQFSPPMVFEEHTDIRMTGQTGTGTAEVEGRFTIVLVPNGA